MPALLDGLWKYASSDAAAPILDVPAKVTSSPEFEQLAQLKLVRPGTTRHIVCPGCFRHSEDVETIDLPDGSKKFFVFCPDAGTEEVTADDMRQWRIHFSALPGMLAALLGMREPRLIVPDALWKLGRYGDIGDIWMARRMRSPGEQDWLSHVPRTPETILLYIGSPPDSRQLADMPQGNIIDVSELLGIGDGGLHLDMGPVDAALHRSVNAPVNSRAFTFRQEGDYWRLVFNGKSVIVKHTQGMLYIHHLLKIAPAAISTLQLRRVAVPDFQPALLGSAGEMLDERALKQIDERLAGIVSELDEAKARQDFGVQSDLAEEQELLKEQLHSAVGLGGRRRSAGDDLERNRKTVGNTISAAIKNITNVHPELGQHLKSHISSGDQCAYRQEQGMVWST